MGLLDKLQTWAKEQGVEPPNPAMFNDPLALRTAWTPLKPGGASFRTHKLMPVEPDGMEMQKTFGMFLFALVFLLVGLGCSVGAATGGSWLMAVVGVPFAIVGGAFLLPKTIRFDGSTREYTAGGKSIAFSQIHAMQIIKERVTGDKTSYFSYELNLVLKDCERLNVTDHADLASIRSDAARLQVMLGCQLWDAA